jgi:signal peptidase I
MPAMSIQEQIFAILKKLDTFVITKKGLFLTPIIIATITIIFLPIVFVPSLLLSFILIFYRAIKIRHNKLKTFFVSFVIVLISAVIVRSIIAEARYIAGESMVPTLQDQTRVIVDKISYIAAKPRRGDIVIFANDILMADGKRISKTAEQYRMGVSRIAAIPGDQVEVKQGVTYINGKSLPGLSKNAQGELNNEEAFTLETCQALKNKTFRSDRKTSVNNNPIIKGLGFSSSETSNIRISSNCHYILKDDNRNSGETHLVLEGNIMGKLKARFWPLNQIGNI